MFTAPLTVREQLQTGTERLVYTIFEDWCRWNQWRSKPPVSVRADRWQGVAPSSETRHACMHRGSDDL